MLRKILMLLFLLICAANAQTNYRQPSTSMSALIENLRRLSQMFGNLREAVIRGKYYYGELKKIYSTEEPGMSLPKLTLQKIARAVTYHQRRPQRPPPPPPTPPPPTSSYYSSAQKMDEYGRRIPARR
ncbi:hypothetical protein CRM22_002806 [Opisthorchis felineus]|uniref:Uncharacterized protein n=1 Tax=Opisthorchis felineus TaxID=147828 RepID=A0A4S2M8T0_OPIFE|nr:hypothetical protein CRM22_002806 [Opisthorchis felineus]